MKGFSEMCPRRGAEPIAPSSSVLTEIRAGFSSGIHQSRCRVRLVGVARLALQLVRRLLTLSTDTFGRGNIQNKARRDKRYSRAALVSFRPVMSHESHVRLMRTGQTIVVNPSANRQPHASKGLWPATELGARARSASR